MTFDELKQTVDTFNADTAERLKNLGVGESDEERLKVARMLGNGAQPHVVGGRLYLIDPALLGSAWPGDEVPVTLRRLPQGGYESQCRTCGRPTWRPDHDQRTEPLDCPLCLPMPGPEWYQAPQTPSEAKGPSRVLQPTNPHRARTHSRT